MSIIIMLNWHVVRNNGSADQYYISMLLSIFLGVEIHKGDMILFEVYC